MINLVLALVWGLFGIVLIAYHSYTGDPRWRAHLIGGDLSLGWAALLICAYNLVRYYFYRMVLADRRAAEELRIRRAQILARKPPPQYGEPNPDFRFSDEPPP